MDFTQDERSLCASVYGTDRDTWSEWRLGKSEEHSKSTSSRFSQGPENINSRRVDLTHDFTVCLLPTAVKWSTHKTFPSSEYVLALWRAFEDIAAHYNGLGPEEPPSGAPRNLAFSRLLLPACYRGLPPAGDSQGMGVRGGRQMKTPEAAEQEMNLPDTWKD
ncbi:hypothetical protein NHX12_033346 [Muraenolepis orangiensis]|uniref:Uncharacterized protein n=1 Tax=Muraenolepis orangiensis TaxID=630683 RepID=A0A9Q0IIL9_9TELE|nr:hypothetical protein NHX12_033346 [Muraenolepis orangiensis]